MSKLHDLNKAKAENAEAKSWTCQTCDTMTNLEAAHREIGFQNGFLVGLFVGLAGALFVFMFI